MPPNHQGGKSKGLRVVVTGGSGYVGSRVAAGLREEGFDVAIYDLVRPKDDSFDHFIGDVCNGSSLRAAFLGAIAVVHTAGYGLVGLANLPVFNDTTRRVNVEGTRTVIKACLECNVKHLVYTSSLNVGFDGTEGTNVTEEEVDEKMKYSSHLDEYSRTKYLAEQMILKTKGIRLGGIYGPNEKYIVPKTITAIRTGFFNWINFGSSEKKLDFLHIDNAVQAHVKAVEMLMSEDENQLGLVDKQAFNISDDDPISAVDFFNYVHCAMHQGRKVSHFLSLPAGILMTVALILENIFCAVISVTGRSLHLPFWALTRMEAAKLNVSNYASIAKAKKVLGYSPKLDTKTQWKEILASFGISTD